MKTLLLMRHAKSDQHVPGVTDHDRPLNDRGLRDAPVMGYRMKEEEVQPELIISSTALRAKTTAELFAEANGYYPDIVFDRKLYMASVEDYMDIIHQLPDEAKVVMLVSHNPGTEEMVAYLSGVERAMPTAAICLLRYDVDAWSEVKRRNAEGEPQFWTPKDVL